jgi:hypothetical protein
MLRSDQVRKTPTLIGVNATDPAWSLRRVFPASPEQLGDAVARR